MNVFILTPPHPRARARSLPVPKGRTPTAGAGVIPIWSRTESTHPTVPSPPQASTRNCGTLRNSSKLRIKWQKENEWSQQTFIVSSLMRNSLKPTTDLSYPRFGPPCVKSNTCRGFKSHWNFCNSLAPCAMSNEVKNNYLMFLELIALCADEWGPS